MGAAGTKDTKKAGKTSRSPRGVLSPAARLAKAKRASILLKQVSDPVRLSILLNLATDERSVSELCAVFEQSQPALSHHLALLRLGGIVSPRREGKQNFYSLTDLGEGIVNAVQALLPSEQPSERDAPATTPIDPTLLEDVGGFVDDPEGWFSTPNVEFEGRRPIELLGTPDELTLRDRIEAAKLGMFS